MTFQAYTGICAKGPLDGKVRTHRSPRLPLEGGSYYWRPAKGPKPGEWFWVETKVSAK